VGPLEDVGHEVIGVGQGCAGEDFEAFNNNALKEEEKEVNGRAHNGGHKPVAYGVVPKYKVKKFHRLS